MSNEFHWAEAAPLILDIAGFQRSNLIAAWKTLTAVGGVELPLPQLHLFDCVSSTNQTVWELWRQGAGPGTAVLALRQDAGRGQWGRQWVSPPGGVYLSLAIAPQIPVAQAAQLTLAGAWGIAHQLQTLAVPVQLKWPNDLVLGGRKLGGILTETRIYQGHITQAVVGVGINWENAVPEPGISLRTWLMAQPAQRIESLEQVVAIALYGILFGVHYWQSAGVSALLAAYTELFLNLGEPVEIEGQWGAITGVTSEGQLRIQLLAPPESATQKPEILLNPGAIRLGYGQTGENGLTQG